MNAESRIQNPEKNCPGRFIEDGFEILTDFYSPDGCGVLANDLSLLHEEHLLRILPEVNELAHSSKVKGTLKRRLNKDIFPVRALFFDKTPDANWRVAWHQDLTIAVSERIETPDFEAWSVKEEIHHVQPPREILEGMITLRLHLDHCDISNGALKVIPRSHSNGKLDSVRIQECTAKEKIAVCEVPKGGALLMRPLLLHSSSSSKSPSHRRVLHLEYASDELPNGLKWFERQ